MQTMHIDVRDERQQFNISFCVDKRQQFSNASIAYCQPYEPLPMHACHAVLSDSVTMKDNFSSLLLSS